MRKIKFNKNKLGVSEMLSYVILISIAIGISIGVFIWLKDYANISPKIDCKEGTSMVLETYQEDENYAILTLRNNGLFNISGFILTVGDDPQNMPVEMLDSPESSSKKLGHYDFSSPLGLDETKEAQFFLKEGYDINVVQIQPYIKDERGRITVCENALIRREVGESTGVPSSCGDDNKDGTDVCDGSDLDGETCLSQGFDSGTLACKIDCSGYITTGCITSGGLPAIFSDASLVSWWKFENTVDDEKLINNGINNGITYAAGKSGQAAVFDGSSYVSISSSDSITNAIADGKISVSYWIKQDTLSNYQAHFNFFKDSSNRQYLMSNSSGNLRVWQSPGSTGNIDITSSSYLNTNWKHVVWVIDGTSNKIYVDGLYKETLTLTNSLSTLGTGVGAFMGYSGNPTTYEYYLDGAMDEVMLFDKVLSDTETQQIYDYYMS